MQLLAFENGLRSILLASKKRIEWDAELFRR